MPPQPVVPALWETKFISVIFCVLLGFSFWAVSVNWTTPSLYGNEFRQTQTAISAQFIQRENNFSFAYPTPVLGKPWSIPYEFPLYQWTVVVISNHTGLSLTSAGRLVGAFCFYAGLPALFLILRRLGLTKTYCLVVLSLVVTCPLYIFYARAFLIETMALMFGLWYFASLEKAIGQRSLGWLTVANLAGIGVGLVKVTTFGVFLLPAFACSVGWIWQSRPRQTAPGWGGAIRTTGWLAAAHALPFAATLWWIHFSDDMKLLNPNSAVLTSTGLAAFNFGIGHRFDLPVWKSHWKIISEEIVSPLTLSAGALVATVFARRWWTVIVGCLGLYVLVQAIFPVLYAAHTYYHLASAFLLICALGFGVVGAFETKHVTRAIPLAVWVTFAGLQACTYFKVYYPIQHVQSNRGGLVDALKNITQPREVLVIAGNDWSSIIPYYAERRALMLRNDVSHDEASLRKSFTLLSDEPVGALVLMDHERDNDLVRRLATEYFGIEAEPFFTCRNRGTDSVVYLNHQMAREAQEILQKMKGYFEGVEPVPRANPGANPLAGVILNYDKLLPRHDHLFHNMNPRPVRFYSSFGPELWDEDKPAEERYAAHPDTKLWFNLSPGHHQLTTTFVLVAGAYQGVSYPERSDGAELVAAATFADGRRDILRQRYFNPRDNPADRGFQPIDWSFDLPAGAELELSVNAGPKGNAARDWAALSSIKIE